MSSTTTTETSDYFFYHMASQLMSGARNTELTSLAVAGTALLGGSLYYYLNSTNTKNRKNNVLLDTIDLKNQSREVKNHEDGSRISNINNSDILLSNCFQDGKTLYELFLRGKKISNNNDYLGTRKTTKEPFKWLSYSQVNDMAEKIGSAFIHFGLQPAKETLIGIYAKNRPEWVITEEACNAYSFVTVPLYDTLGEEAIQYILLQTEMRLVVCDDSEKAMHLMKSRTNLEYIVVVDQIKDEIREKATEMNIKLVSFDEIQEIGQTNLRRPIPPNENDMATICYTSGTTGQPKGAMITHRNMVSIGSSMYINLEQSKEKFAHEGAHRYLSYLPLAHMLERVSQSFIKSFGGKIGFYQGDIKLLSEDLRDLKPTIFITVPRLLNRIYSKVTDNLERAPFYKKFLFRWAFANKEQEVLKGIVRNNSIYDYVFKQIRESLGGSVKFIFTGSAPISTDVLHFLRVVCGCHVLEGYGATETGGASSVQIPHESTVGNVGPPFACCMYKLIDVPSMNLDVKRDNKGEICVFGTNIFKGYYKDEEKTREALDDDGWYHTGDIGIWETNGTLKIVDRVKNIFKLQQGEYVAPEKIENIYVRSRYVAQSFVYGNSYKSSLVGIIVPEETIMIEWAKNNNLANLSFKDLCANSEVKQVILKDLELQAKAGGLKGFEKVKDIYLHDELFSIENGLLTPTMKSKRNDLQKYFQSQLDVMNSHLD